jgi:hypothetical protein
MVVVVVVVVDTEAEVQLALRAVDRCINKLRSSSTSVLVSAGESRLLRRVIFLLTFDNALPCNSFSRMLLINNECRNVKTNS